MRTNSGFSLVELMIVVALIGIIAAVAYPSYQDQIQRGRRAEGQGLLMEVMQAQERMYTESFTYTVDLTELGFTDGGSGVESDGGFYTVQAAACGGSTIRSCVELTATPQGVQAEDTDCATITLDSRGAKGGSTAGVECWQ